ncbi:MAG TPA: PIG-L family deacetylase [Steroidobacteraceae bacterium]|nr:PIG-L family deacetylase [Steroidobacteraceae bacterium]
MLRPHGRSVARLLPAVITAAWAAAAGAVPPADTAAAPPAAAAAELPRLDGATSLLVVAPHPDDETLCCAGVIQRVVRAGGRASIVWITSGDASFLDLLLIEKSLTGSASRQRALAERRMHEARAAASLLGVPDERQLFLGYPDRGVLELLSAHHDAPYTSRSTASAAVPYPDALFPGHAYTGASLERDFAAVLERIHPTLVLAPSPRDSHPDHRGAALLALRTMAARGELSSVRCWIVHGGEGWPSPRQLSPGLPLTRAPLSAGVPLAPFELTPAEEDLKLAAVRAYPTQLTTLAPFLLAFVRTTEVFSAAP